jgi:hypothetical protein
LAASSISVIAASCAVGSKPKAAAQAARPAASSKCVSSARGIAMRAGTKPGSDQVIARLNGSARSSPAKAEKPAQASSRHVAKTETQSRLRQAGTTPRVETAPTDGFSPTMPFNAAGTRPDPAVSVPSASVTIPRATATADPEEDPPGT